MDEENYKEVYKTVNELPCVFEKAVLTRMFACEKAVKVNIAEREVVGCAEVKAHDQCAQLLHRMRSDAAFTLKLTHISGPLPHAKEIKVQCGGLLGLQASVTESVEPQPGVENIFALIEAARRRFDQLNDFPHQAIIQSVARFEARRKRGRRR